MKDYSIFLVLLFCLVVAYGFLRCPPPADHPDEEKVECAGKISSLNETIRNCYPPVNLEILGRFIDERVYDESYLTEVNAIYHSVIANDINTLSLLAYLGANLEQTYGYNFELYTLLHLAAERGCDSALRWLLCNGVSVNVTDRKGATPLHYAASVDQLSTAKTLIANGACVDYLDKYNQTPIDDALYRNVRVAELLIENGADLSKYNSTPVYPAANTVGGGSLKIVKALLDNGACVDCPDERNLTALHYAAGRGDLEMVKLLVQSGADVDARGANGKTPLHVAVLCGRLEVVKQLVESGADVNIKDEDGFLAPLNSTAHVYMPWCCSLLLINEEWCEP